MLRLWQVCLIVACGVIAFHEVARIFLDGTVFREKPKDHYQTLGVKRSDSQDAIRKAFRTASLLHHPDKNQDDDSAKVKYGKIMEAYQILNDLTERATYDSENPGVRELLVGKGEKVEVPARHIRTFEFEQGWWTLDAFTINVWSFDSTRLNVAVYPGYCLNYDKQQDRRDGDTDGTKHTIRIDLKEKSWEPHCVVVQSANLLFPSTFGITVDTELDYQTLITMVSGALILAAAWEISSYFYLEIFGYISLVWLGAMVAVPLYLECSCSLTRVCYGADVHPLVFVAGFLGVGYLLWVTIFKRYRYSLRLGVTAFLCVVGTVIVWRSTPYSWWPQHDAINIGNHQWLPDNLHCGVSHNVALLEHWGAFRWMEGHLPHWLAKQIIFGVHSLLAVLGGDVSGSSMVVRNSLNLARVDIHLMVFVLFFIWQVQKSKAAPLMENRRRVFRGKGQKLGGNRNRNKLLQEDKEKEE